MTLYGYARVSVREPEDKNLTLQVERLVRAGCSLGNIRSEEASGARNDRGGLLELLDLVVEGDTLMVTHIDRLSRGLTHGLQVIEGLHRAGVEFRSLSEEFDTATATGKLQLTMVLAFSEWWRNSIRERSVAGQAKARAEGRFPGRRPSLSERQREYIRAERRWPCWWQDWLRRLRGPSRWPPAHSWDHAPSWTCTGRDCKGGPGTGGEPRRGVCRAGGGLPAGGQELRGSPRAMADEIAQDKDLWLRTMAEKELGISFEETTSPVKDALVMGLSFIKPPLCPSSPTCS